MTTLEESFQLDCSVFGAEPKPFVFWEETKTHQSVSDAKVSEEIRSDGTYDVTVTFTGNASVIGNGISYTCSASGIAVNWIAENEILLQRVEAALPTICKIVLLSFN